MLAALMVPTPPDDELDPARPPEVPPNWPPGTRSRIMAAMAAVVAERGYVDTRVIDVITRAGGMSNRTFYRHFSDREDCFFAVYEAARIDALAALAPETTPESPLVRLRAALDRGLQHLAASPALAHVLLVDIVALGPHGAARHEETMSEMAQLLIGCEAWEPQASNQLATAEQAQALIGAFHRVVSLRLAEGRHDTLPEIAPGLTALVWPAAARLAAS